MPSLFHPFIPSPSFSLFPLFPPFPYSPAPSEFASMFLGLAKIDFPTVVEVEGDEAEEEAVVEAEAEETEGETGEGEGEVTEEVKEKVVKAVKAVKAKGARAEGVSSASSNILYGPWVGLKSKGPESWGLGTETQSLRSDLAESCAERERYRADSRW